MIAFPQLLLTGMVALIISVLVTPMIRRIAYRWRLTDRPDSHRKLHNQPIPLGGGISILLALWGAVAVALCASRQFRDEFFHEGAEANKVAGFFLASAGIVVLGLIDDRLTIRGRHKLIGQICIALLLCWFGYDIQSIKAFGLQLDLGLLAVPVTVGWLVLATNSLNLIDGVDGLASTVGVILSLTMACLALLNGHPGEAVLLSALAGATLGFLRYNFPPAQMFLGDAGSMLIGMSLGALSISSALKGPTVAGLVAPLAIWTVPLFDTFAAIAAQAHGS